MNNLDNNNQPCPYCENTINELYGREKTEGAIFVTGFTYFMRLKGKLHMQTGSAKYCPNCGRKLLEESGTNVIKEHTKWLENPLNGKFSNKEELKAIK